ncbi:MAG TPA: hypothetical protein VJ799_12675 [Nitrososphaeraceae archaeon]|nr:hypothetical protein [Nitrososphaeraceae archaeon]
MRTTHLCDEPEYKDNPECNPNVTPPVFSIEPESVLENEEIVDENDTPEPPEPDDEGADERGAEEDEDANEVEDEPGEEEGESGSEEGGNFG